MKFSDPEFRRFLLAGAFNTAVGYGLYLLLNTFLDYRGAYTISYVLGIVLSYAITTAFVFKRPWRWRRLLAYPSVYAVQYLVGLALIWLMVDRLGLPDTWAPLIILPITIPLTFALSRLIVKGRHRESIQH